MAKKKRKPDKNKQRIRQTRTEAGISRNSYDELVRQKFKQSIRNLKSRNLPEPEVYDGLDFDSNRQKRRVQAISRMLDTVKERIKEICPDVPGHFSIEEEWAEINSFPIPAYDFEERFTYSVVGAVIWMLDQIKEADRMDELLYLIKPVDDKVIFNVPPIWDPCHSNDVIYSMVDAVLGRNDPEDRSGFWPGEIRRPYMNQEVTSGTVDPNWVNRASFNAILDLIPSEAVNKAVENYTNGYWDFLTRYFRSRNVLVKQSIELKSEMDAFGEKVDSIVKNLSAANSGKLSIQSNPNIRPINAASLPFANPISHRNESVSLSPALITVTRLDSESDQLGKREEMLAQKVEALWQRCGFLNQWPVDRIRQKFGVEIADIWKDTDIGDPYEMCFALMYLVDSGSDLPWCYFAGVNFHTAYSSLLPWPRTRFNILADGIWNYFDEETGDIRSGPAETVLPKRIRVPDLEDWYKLQYQDSSDEDDLYNLGQIIYEATGCLMPRKLDRYHPALGILDRYGISGKRALHPLLYCMTLLGEGKHQTKPYFSSIDFIPEDPDQDADSEQATDENLLAEIASLKTEIKKLKQISYDASRELRDEKTRYETLAQKAANDAQELHDLRELVFNQQANQYDEQGAATDIAFPYRTERRIVVFGGHDSWSREMKPKFPDVRFIDRDMLPNPDLIRHADVVWIQTNALAHKYFYRIIEEVRKHNILLRYFSYSGVAKCAEQIVKEDRKHS